MLTNAAPVRQESTVDSCVSQHLKDLAWPAITARAASMCLSRRRAHSTLGWEVFVLRATTVQATVRVPHHAPSARSIHTLSGLLPATVLRVRLDTIVRALVLLLPRVHATAAITAHWDLQEPVQRTMLKAMSVRLASTVRVDLLRR